MDSGCTEIVRAQWIAEFIEGALANTPQCADAIPNVTEIVRARHLASFVEDALPNTMREFVVVWKNREMQSCRVRGIGLDMIGDQGGVEHSHYAVWTNEEGGKVLVAIFGAGEVAGIFDGALDPPPTIGVAA